MRILSRFRQFNELRSLRMAARRSPTPTTIGVLAERFISMGRIEEASRMAQRGLSLFPRSRRLSTISVFATKHRLRAQIERLRREMKESPNPTVFGQLAEIYRELGDDDTAMEVCERCIERFPLNENPYLISGAIRLDRFIDDRTAGDGLEAEMQLRRVVKLNDQNTKAHLLLGRLYYIIGALESAKQHLRAVVELTPGAREIERLLANVEARTHAPVEPDDGDDGAGDEHSLSIPDLIRAVEARSDFLFPPETFPAIPGSHSGVAEVALDVETLKESLGQFSRERGVQHALILDRDGAPLADTSGADSLTRNEFADLVTDILQTARSASRKMDIGRLADCTIKGPFGGISITRLKNLSISLRYDSSVRSERAAELVEEFTSGGLSPHVGAQS